MASDVISRDDVLDVLFDYWYKQNIVGCSGKDVYEECAVMIKQLPSVQPSLTKESAIDYVTKAQ